MLSRGQPKKAANSRPLENAAKSWIVARSAMAVTGPIPGMVISRLAVSSVLADASSVLSDRLDRFVERIDLSDERSQGEAHAVGNHDLTVLIDVPSPAPDP